MIIYQLCQIVETQETENQINVVTVNSIKYQFNLTWHRRLNVIQKSQRIRCDENYIWILLIYCTRRDQILTKLLYDMGIFLTLLTLEERCIDNWIRQ